MSNSQNDSTTTGSSTVWQIVGRLITAAIVLAITAFFTPNFTINNIWSLALAAIVLTIMDYLIIKFTGLHASPFGKGFVGFALAAIIFYFTPYFFTFKIKKTQRKIVLRIQDKEKNPLI